MHEQSWFDMLFSKYIPFMVRDRFAYSVKPLEQPELERFEGIHILHLHRHAAILLDICCDTIWYRCCGIC
jgi:hypothetical protein